MKKSHTHTHKHSKHHHHRQTSFKKDVQHSKFFILVNGILQKQKKIHLKIPNKKSI